MAMIKTCKMPVLQEKSASGAVASFNTALAMPLPSCNIAVNAWQEGSGDPSPVNNRPIHGFSEVNATRAGKNLLKMNGRVYANPSAVNFSNTTPRTFVPNSYCYCLIHTNYYNRSWMANIINISLFEGGFQCESTQDGNQAYSTMCFPILDLKIGATYSLSATFTNCSTNIAFYKADGTYISGSTNANNFVIPNETKYTVLIFKALETGVFSASNIQLELGSTATAYEPYVTPTIYTIQLGQEVYGAEVDVVNGVAHCTHAYYKTTGNETINAYNYNNQHGVSFLGILPTAQNKPEYISNMSLYKPTTILNSGAVWCGVNSTTIYWIGILDLLNMSLEDFKLWIVDHPLEVAYIMKSENQFDIQLTPTQIETLIGNNTIFADTGDIDLTYKDLDIAKRGNFREVFKLP